MANLTLRLDKMQLSGVQAKAVAVVCEYCQDNHESNECPSLLSSDPPQQMQVNGIWYDQRPPPQNISRNQNFPSGSNNFQKRVQGTGLDFKSNNYFQPPPIQSKESSDLEKLNQIGQLAKKIVDRTPGTFPSNAVTNPKEDCLAITTRSGKVLSSPEVDKRLDEAGEPEKEIEKPAEVVKPAEKEIEKGKNVTAEKNHELSPEYMRVMAPYPERFKQDVQKQQYARKHKLQECQTVTLTEECSAIIQKKFPPKLRDPGSFNIPIAIGNTDVGKALCDLGASINLMSLSVCKSLGIFELKPTMVSLQLADRSLRRPSGIVEDVLVKVDKFIFPADFVVLDMEEGTEMPLLMGRPFLATARDMIDIENGKLELDVLDKVVEEEKYFSQDLEKELEAHDIVPFKEEKSVVFEVLEKKDSDKEDGAPKVELKELPETLKYIFLGDEETYPVIINKGLSEEQEMRLTEVLKNHKTAIGWSISDLKGINLSFCTHKILMEDDVRPVRQPQRRLNPTMKEVVRKEV
ncbi:uncharacterized protein LOC133297272 [Gastrolobium bilobum]|uniref:uncharacterized protein LOC133297272 n=1 Tax=Gastrolobium bilobum TaxID=150636 RepID=UPI002AB07F24|nr:uncharacterized protein LOC133297272 [Gastrolobium bilobum]